MNGKPNPSKPLEELSENNKTTPTPDLQKGLSIDLIKLKDKLLAMFLLNYAVGYVSFSIYAYNNSLGNVSAFDLQYFIAGLVPSTASLLLIWLNTKSNKFYESIIRHLEEPQNWVEKILRICVINYYILGVLVVLPLLFLPNSKTGENLFYLLAFLFAVVICFALLRPSNAGTIFDSPIKRRFRKIRFESQKKLKYKIEYANVVDPMSATSVFIAPLISLLLIYYIRIYPIIPQELGGVKPKTAILYSDKNIFLYTKKNAVRIDTIYLDTVTVYYYNKDIIIYKNYRNPSNAFEVNRISVTNIKWLDE